jgi:predicted helicase
MKNARIHYARVDEFWRKEQKYAYLEEKQHVGDVEWEEIQPDLKHSWLTEGMQEDFEDFLQIANKTGKAESKTSSKVIYSLFGRGVSTSRDAWAYNFCRDTLRVSMAKTIEAYNGEVAKWVRNQSTNLDEFLAYNDKEIWWSESLKLRLQRGQLAEFSQAAIRGVLYRPYVSQNLYFDRAFNERVYVFPSIFPTTNSEVENRLICLTGQGSEKPFMTLVSSKIVDLHLVSPGCSTQCFPFYTYSEDGTNRRENITDWALKQFRTHYKDKLITKWNIFHYVYALLHHPLYRERYAANLKRELPRIPFAPDFRGFEEIGKRLAEIHVHYEQQQEYPLEKIEAPDKPLDWRVEKMKLSKHKRSLIYNDFLTLDGIPAEVFEYRLGNRTALDWIIDQYQLSLSSA